MLISLLSYSCRRLAFTTIDFQETEEYPGAGIGVSAQLLSDPEEIKELFHIFLPDSGVIPVLVGVRNNDTSPAVINGCLLNGVLKKHGGISLTVDGEEFIPLTPFEVMDIMLGGKGAGYRKKGFGNLVAGSIFPPLGTYYVYDEATRGRLFRGLEKNSLYGVDKQHFFRPISLNPGEERTGYLYFPLSRDKSPYEIVIVPGKKKRDDPVEKIKVKDNYDVQLTIKTKAIPATPGFQALSSRRDTLSFYDICFDPPKGDIGKLRGFLLREDRNDGSISSLVFTEFSYPPGGRAKPEREVEIDDIQTIAEVADVAAGNNFAACGINFTRKSRIYFVSGMNDGPRLRWTRDLGSKILRLFTVEDGLLAVCENGLCYYISSADGKIDKRDVKFAADLNDVFCYAGRIYVFGNRELKIYSIGEESLFDRIGTFEICKAEREVAGSIDGMLALLYRSGSLPGDTLVLINPDDALEISRMPLPGRVAAAHCGGNVTVQLQNGVVLQFELSGGSFLLRRNSLLTSSVDELAAAGDEVLVADKEGVIQVFNINNKLPSPVNFSREARVTPSPERKKRAVGIE